MLQPISTASNLANRRPYEVHHIVFSDTDVGTIPDRPKSNSPFCEQSDTMVDEDVESNQDGSISSSVVFPSDVLISNPDGPGDESQLNSPLGGSTTTLRVRFRPRVRITSGLNRHRRKRPTMENHPDYFTFTPSSSTSGSSSSSISAPLRTPLDDEVGKPGWGTLGQRVGLFAKRQYPGKTTRNEPEGGLIVKGNEQTPLLNPSLRFFLRHDSRLRYLYHNGSEEEISRWIDRAFGPWPARLLNHHWWQWKLEPLMACRCPIDCDDEECT